MTHPLPDDVARCRGVGDWEDGEWDWREGCDDCQRRTSPGGTNHLGPAPITPDPIIAFECPWRIAP